ncbi:MAG: heavy metal-responsive transcriptional regulator [Acidobacteriota bacterium]|nr:heavy metal-responsive transcriptional regulator [Acidobacteriota bacterium]
MRWREPGKPFVYYERVGLLPKPPRSGAGYRQFSPESVRRVRFIKRAQELGFSLKEIKELLALRIAPGSTRADVRKRAEAKIADIEGKVQHLRAMKKTLVRLSETCCGSGPASDCPILESLSLEKEK